MTWEYDRSKSRVTDWTVRHRVRGVGAGTVRSITDPNAREAFFDLNAADSGRTFLVEVVAVADGISSSGGGQTSVTLSKF